MFNYNHLYYFFITASQGSITEAAKILKISQPSLSCQLKQLERELGHKLFRRAGRGLMLSTEGEQIHGLCQKMFASLPEFDLFLKGSSSHQKPAKKIKFGVSKQIEDLFVADLVSLMHTQATDDLVIHVLSGSQVELVEKLRSGEIDLLLTNSGVFGAEFIERLEIEMPVSLFAATQQANTTSSQPHSRAGLQKILRDAAGVGLILPTDVLRLRFETDLFLQRYDGVHARVVIESDVLSVLSRAVIDGLGMAFLPLPYIHDDWQRGQVVSLTGTVPLWTHKFYVVSCKQKKLWHSGVGASETELQRIVQRISEAMNLLNQFVPASVPTETLD